MRELNNEERLLDFIAFILSDYSELLDNVNYFFCENFSKEVLSKYDKNKESNIYKFYLKETIGFDSISKILKQYDLFNYTEQNKIDLINYLNNNYRHGYPDDVDEEGFAYGGRYKINLDFNQFELYLDDYFSLSKINKSIFISYFKYLLFEIKDSIMSYLEKEYNLIKKIHYNSIQINPEIKLDFIEYYKNFYKSNYIKTFNDNFLFFEINKNENDSFNINFKKSLINQVTKIKELEINVIYTRDNIDFKNDLNGFIFDLFLYTFENIPLIKNQSKINKIYDEITKEKSDYINFLKGKGFNNNDINNILNILSNNILADLGFKFLKRYNLKKVEIFRLLYFFYVFDFFKEHKRNDLKKINDFKEVINFQTLNVNSDEEQFRKYFNDIGNNKSKHYPFRNSDETFRLLDGVLEDKHLLKSIPKDNNLNFY